MKLEEINALYEKATPGWWGPFGMGLFADSVGDRNVSRCSYVAQFYTTDVHDRPRTFDIDFVAETHNSWPAIYRELMAARDLFSHCKFTGDETSETHHALIGRVPVVELDLYVAARKENDQ